MVALHVNTPRDAQARDELATALPDDATVGPLDEETGAFDVELDADSHEEALQVVFDAVAAAGADDHVVFAEHPNVPQHWRRAPAS
jgi:ApbE superfamily uncharacterized protein (UPF0280 family)